VKEFAPEQSDQQGMKRERGAPTGPSGGQQPAPDKAAPSRAGYADFFARVSHDLRSPLGIVMHVMQRLEADLGAALSDEQKVLLKLGGRGVRRLQGFVERVGLLSELENDDLEVSTQPVDLGQLLKRAVEANVAHEPRSDVTVSYEAPASTCMALADAALLSRAVGELLTNAVAHARRNVRAGIIGDGPSIFIEDDGPGVQEHARKSLYQRFVVRDARGGLGIGLSMVRELLHAQAGDIRLEQSTLPPGRPDTVGARFVLSLPHVAVTPRPGAE